jgi:hypothetical protein
MAPPPCDKHKNLQMVPLGQTSIYVCPVPSCDRCHGDQGYFEVVEGQLLRGQSATTNRLSSARERILKAIRARAGA